MMHNNEIPTEQQMKQICSAREQDILIRGTECLVYDYSGRVVKLGSAMIWYDDNCNYVKPKSSQVFECTIS